MNKDEVEKESLKHFSWLKSIRIGNRNGYMFDDDANRILEYFERLTEKAYRDGCGEGKNATNPAEFGDVWSRGYKAGLRRARDIVKDSKSLLLVDIASAIHTEAEAE